MPRKSQTRLKISLDIGENEKDPAEFRDAIVLAEKLGFDVAWLGDHFMPWMDSGNRSAYVWSLIASSLEASRKIKIGPYVTTPIGARYHPALVAQASATLDNMFPGRFLLGVGTGEAVNEAMFLPKGWPSWKERTERLVEGTQLMRKLWTSTSYFDFDGSFFKEKQIFLYTKPRTNLKIYFSAVGEKFAEISGRYGDGLITLGSRNPLEKCRDVIFPSFDRGATSVGKDTNELEKIMSLSFTMEDPDTYLKTHKLHAGNLDRRALSEPDPRKIENMGANLPDEVILKSTNFCSDWSDVVELIHGYKEIGVNQIVLPSGPDKKKIRAFAKKILPSFK
ncbi:MAG TPA: LLM class flavin-dependent oxidoreductase [Nitrososphaerales archaeon]|nr:LLM class flavin-dependent oxidoreductase [Nitrososphaerales archaeon]